MIYISVIVPFYNADQYIVGCVEGLLSQNYPLELYEIIMVDNNCTDDSAEIVKRYPCVKLFSEEKQGAYAARNRGVREEKGKIIAFTDPDCVPSSEEFEAKGCIFLIVVRVRNRNDCRSPLQGCP